MTKPPDPSRTDPSRADSSWSAPPQRTLDTLPFEEMALILNGFSEGLLVIDRQGVVISANKTAQLLYSDSDYLMPGMLLADYAAQDWIEVRRVLASGQAQNRRTLVLPNAEVLISRIPIFQGNSIIGVVSTMQDIRVYDDVVKNLHAYTQLQGEYEAVLERDDDAFVIVDAAGVIQRVNMAFERMVALGRQALIGRNIGRLRQNPANIIPLVQNALDRQQWASIPGKGIDGTPLLTTVAPVFDESGLLSMVICRIHELSSARLREQTGHLFHPDTASRDSHGGGPEWNVKEGANAANEEPLDHALSAICVEAQLIAVSRAMRQTVRQALKVSQVESSVLVQGESGAGKSMLASIIHNQSPRRDAPFIVINCGAIPEGLMESEFFGYEKGAFTGASPQGKTGLLEAANKGTVFLDEVGELPLSLQVKLLEVIEKKSFMRVGGTKRISVDIRIIAATNKTLEQEIEHGTFRKDLYYRLNVIPLRIPALRERPEDIQAMALDILRQHNARHGTAKELSPAVSRWLMQHSFPGNARELVNIMEWMLVMGEGDVLTLHDLPAGLQQEGMRYLAEMEACPAPSGVAQSAPLAVPQGVSPPEQALSSPVPTQRGDAATPRENAPDSPVSKDFVSAVVKPADTDEKPDEFTVTIPIDLNNPRPLKQTLQMVEEAYLRAILDRAQTLQKASVYLDVHFSTLWRKMLQYDIKQ